MGRLWEIQLLVLLSFTLQLFLFFTGGLRRRSRCRLLRGAIWIAYLGADMVAIYALGILSRDAADANASSSLAFLWAPFLLIHLGGQDTITAFAVEDNTLWLRHLLNLLVQVTLALYVFGWKSSSCWHRHSSTQQDVLLVPGILLFAAGIIKYGERTAALMQGGLNRRVVDSKNSSSTWTPAAPPPTGEDLIIMKKKKMMMIYDDALRSAPAIRMLFASHKTQKVVGDLMKTIHPAAYDDPSRRHRDLFRLMDLELGMMYNDLYTKAAVLRTKTGIVARCISLACTVTALVLFFFLFSRRARAAADNTNTFTDDDTVSGGRVDTAITYTLFIGGLAVDVCSLLAMLMASPRTCWAAWLHARCLRGHSRIASVCPCLLCCDCDTVSSGWRWSNTMGQYRFVCYEKDSAESWSSPPPTLSEVAMCCVARKLMVVGGGAQGQKKKKKLFFCLSKLLETKRVVVDDSVTMCLVREIDDIAKAAALAAADKHQHAAAEQPQWRCLGQLLLEATQRPELTSDFVRLISCLHACTEVLLRKAAAEAAAKGISIATGTAGAAASADVCRKLSRYMMYLVVVAAGTAGGGLLQVVSGDPEMEFQRYWERYPDNDISRLLLDDDDLRPAAAGSASSCCSCSSGSGSRLVSSKLLPCPEVWEDTLDELKRMWARLLIYAASKSRPEAHAAALARGGELLTFVWLLLSRHGLGASSTTFRVEIDLVGDQPQHAHSSGSKSGRTYYVFSNLPVQMVNCCSCTQLHKNMLTASTPTGSHSHQLADP